MTRTARFREADLTRAIRAFEKAGVQIAGVQVNDNGFVVLVGEPRAARRRNRADELYGPHS